MLSERAPAAAPVHRAQHLDVLHGVETEPLRNACLHQFHDPGRRRLGVLGRHEIEVTLALGPGEIGDGAPVDAVGGGDDPAPRRLAEHLGQAHHRHRARGDDVGQHLAGPHRGQLIDVAHDQQRGPVGNSRHQRTHQHDVDHRSLVDHQQIAIERVLRVAPEPAIPGVDLEQAVDRLRLEPGGLAHPLGGAPGRRAQQDIDALGGQDAQDRVDDRRLADARSAGDDGNLRGERRAYRIGLAGRQGEPGLALHPGQGLVRVDVGPWEIAGRDLQKTPGDRPLGPVQAAEEYAGDLPHRVGNHRAFGQLQVQRGADQLAGNLQEFGSERSQLFFRQAAMTLVHRFGQRIADARAHPDHGRLLDAELHRDGVGGHETDAADIAREAVRVLRHHLHGIGAVGPEYPHRPRRADAVAVQEHHDLADHLLLGPGIGDALRPDTADAGHLAQAFGLGLDDVEDLLAERPDQLAGVDRADAPDHPRAEILLDALDRGRLGGAHEARLELLTVGAVVDPLARCGDPLPRSHHGGVADHRHQVAMPPRLRPEHAESVLGIVEGDALDQPGQDLPVRGLWMLAGAGFHDVPGAGAVSSSFTGRRTVGKAPAMSPEEPGIAALTGLKARAAGLSSQLSNGPLEEQRGILHAIIQRIDLTPASIILILHKTALARLLDLPYPDDQCCVSIRVPVRLRRRGVETKMIIDSPDAGTCNVDPDLCRLIAQAHLWFDQLASGEACTVREIAGRAKINEHEITRVLHLAFLSENGGAIIPQ